MFGLGITLKVFMNLKIENSFEDKRRNRTCILYTGSKFISNVL